MDVLSTWGDAGHVGLTELEVLDAAGERVEVEDIGLLGSCAARAGARKVLDSTE